MSIEIQKKVSFVPKSRIICRHGEEDATLQGKINDLGLNIRSAIDVNTNFDNQRTTVIHLSHNDLDGIGALSLTYYMQWYLGRSVDPQFSNSTIPRIQNPLIQWHSTGRLGTAFNTELHTLAHRVTHALEAEVSRIPMDDYRTKIHIPIMVLITDIGSITTNMLASEFFDFLRVPEDPRLYISVNVVVVDHHQTSMIPESDSKDGKNVIYVDGDFVGSEHSSAVLYNAKFLIRNSDDQSGTGILWDLLDHDPSNTELQCVRETVQDITKWDTGHGGNWFIPEEKAGDQDYFVNEVTEAVKLNQWWAIHKNSISDDRHDLEYLIFCRELALRYTSSLRNVDGNQALSVYYGGLFWDSYIDRIHDQLMDLSEKFDKFFHDIRSMYLMVDQEIDLTINGVVTRLKIPDWLDNAASKYCGMPHAVVGVYVRTDKNSPYPSYTNYSRYIYEHYPKKYAWLMIVDVTNDDGSIKFDLRSGDPAVNMAKWAKSFGGGGHPCAAGFTLTRQ